ncbi:hypothetical protein Taro_017232 [Colocasia esculenta]|uniref:Aluminum-activated malate transporter 1 n=1 Tax=Colocasia esculenta TaxID=4460 RepID=A0A843UFR4_COLES|nr:hypothetical protein [Colocasia esculenta]
MEVAIGMGAEKMVVSPSPRCQQLWCRAIGMVSAKAVVLASKTKKVWRDDPRRVLHSMKVGLALAIVSIFYYVNPIYDGFGVSMMWAVLTAVVVMEYTVGGTLSKGTNRAFGTLLAGALGVGAHHLAVLFGHRGEPVLLVIFVFLIGAAASFSRFIPEVKARYDYGTVIFILTFSLVAVSSYRVDELLELAHQRLSTVAIGAAACICISVFVFPVWAGEELHDLCAGNLEKLATYLEGLAAEYFREKDELANVHVKGEHDDFSHAYRPVLNSKNTEETLANLARWEPPHGQFGLRHPWKHYLKLGALARRCAFHIDVLNTHTTRCEEDPHLSSTEFHEKTMRACAQMCSASGNVLRELASSMRKMTEPSNARQHLKNSGAAVESLTQQVVLGKETVLFGVLRGASMASLLVEIVACTRDIAASVEELARVASFRRVDAAAAAITHQQKAAAIKPVSGPEDPAGVCIVVK